MFQRRIGNLFVLALVAIASTGVASAQYYEEEGFFLFLDAVLTTPRDTDQVVATTVDFPASRDVYNEVATDWSSEPAGTVGFGYQWPDGSKVTVSYWQFDNDERTVGDGPSSGLTYFAVGPSYYYYYGFPDYYGYNGFVGAYGAPGHWDFVTDLEATSIDVAWSQVEEIGEASEIEWSVGVRFADFEETMTGLYDYYPADSAYFDEFQWRASKTNEGDMIGFKAGLRGIRRFGDSISVEGGMAVSVLEGEVSAVSTKIPTGSISPLFSLPVSASFEDDNRSGTILDFDVAVVYHLVDDRYRVWLGYGHSTWRGITADLARNPAGMPITIRDRDSITFAGYRIGVGFRF